MIFDVTKHKQLNELFTTICNKIGAYFNLRNELKKTLNESPIYKTFNSRDIVIDEDNIGFFNVQKVIDFINDDLKVMGQFKHRLEPEANPNGWARPVSYSAFEKECIAFISASNDLLKDLVTFRNVRTYYTSQVVILLNLFSLTESSEFDTLYSPLFIWIYDLIHMEKIHKIVNYFYGHLTLEMLFKTDDNIDVTNFITAVIKFNHDLYFNYISSKSRYEYPDIYKD